MHNRRLVGAKIGELREAQGLSLRKFASMINMDYAFICNIEGGRANPSLDSLSKIAAGLDVELIELFENDSGTDYATSKIE